VSNFNDGQDNYNNGWSGGAPDPNRGAVGDQWRRFGQEARARHERSMAEANKPLNFGGGSGGGGSGASGNALGGIILLGLLIAVGVAVFGRHGTDAPADPSSSAPANLTITQTAPDPAAAPAIPAPTQDAVSSSTPDPTAQAPVSTTQTTQTNAEPKKAPADLDGLY
jgi:hypothetical protein